MIRCSSRVCFFFFFFNDTATTEIYTLSLHDALPILDIAWYRRQKASDISRATSDAEPGTALVLARRLQRVDRKSTRLNSSHSQISYAVFCLKKKKQKALNVLQYFISTHRAHQGLPHT